MKRSPDWLAKQLLTLGSTAAGVVTGASPYETRVQLFDKMVAAAEGRITKDDFNDDMRRGILTEPLHRQILEDALGKNVHEHDQEAFLIAEPYPFAHALPDGWIFDIEGETRATRIPVQLKCPRPRAWHEIKLKGIHGHWLIGTQHSLAITGAEKEHFSVLNVETMKLIHFDVYRDEQLIESLMRIEGEFYSLFKARVRPIEEVEKIEIPEIGGEMITVESEEARNLADAYRSAKELRDEAVALMDQAEKRITDLMGQARVIQLPELRCYRLPMAGRKTIDKDALKRDGIEPEKYEKTGKPFTQFRTFNVK